MNATTTPKVARTRQLPNGQIEALSSNGRTIYHVTIGERISCDCPAGQNGRNCYHVTTAINRYPAFYPVPARFARKAEQPAKPRRACPCELYGPDACNGNCKG